jgi:hypothetical protein
MRDQDCKVIIFAQTKKRVDDFFYTIRRLGYPVFPIHGDKRQQERDRVLQGLLDDKRRMIVSLDRADLFVEFRNRTRVVLIATDVAARGLGTSLSSSSCSTPSSFVCIDREDRCFSCFAGTSYGQGVPAIRMGKAVVRQLTI